MTKRDPKDTRKAPIEFEAPVEEAGGQDQVEQHNMESDIDELEREIDSLRKSVEETQSSYLRVLAGDGPHGGQTVSGPG